MNSRVLIASAALLALLGTVSAQTVAQKVPAFQYRFLGCVSASSKYYYCVDGGCYNTQGANSTTLALPSNLKCATNFTQYYDDPEFPSTYSYSYNISELDIFPLPLGNGGS